MLGRASLRASALRSSSCCAGSLQLWCAQAALGTASAGASSSSECGTAGIDGYAVVTTGAAAGGKYTWGSVMDRDGDVATDPRDPNYDSGDEQNGVSYHLQLSVQIKMYKQSVRMAVQQPAVQPRPPSCSSCQHSSPHSVVGAVMSSSDCMCCAGRRITTTVCSVLLWSGSKSCTEHQFDGVDG